MHALWAEPHVTFKASGTHDRGRRHQPAASALDVFGQLRTLTEQAGREPAEVWIEVWVSMGSGTEADWARETHRESEFQRYWAELIIAPRRAPNECRCRMA